MATPMKVSGLKTRLMAKENISTQMGLAMKDNGLKISKRDLDQRHGPMEAIIKVSTTMVKSTDMANSLGKMALHTPETGI
jgi:hypothetical protein